MPALLLLLSRPVLLTVGSILRGWVFSKLWLWFIVPTFHVSPLGVAQSIGLALIVAFLTNDQAHHEDRRSAKDKLIEGLSQMFIGPFITLLIAYLVTLFL